MFIQKSQRDSFDAAIGVILYIDAAQSFCILNYTLYDNFKVFFLQLEPRAPLKES